MSTNFPHVDIGALQALAAAAAAAEHTSRLSRNAPPVVKKSGKGKGKARVQDTRMSTPRVTTWKDTTWAGEKMILLEFDPQTVPLGPHCMLAHFPRGRPTFITKALVGMTSVVRDGAQVLAPKIYGYYDNVPNPVNAEVVLMEMLPGQTLEEIWMQLKPRQVMTICARLGELLVKLFNCRSPLICSETNIPDSPPVNHSHFRRGVLLAPVFETGPLARMDPQEALTSTHDYLLALSKRPERVFGPKGTPALPVAHDAAWPGEAVPTDADIALVRETWNRLGSLIPYHSGGFYIPGSLTPDARNTAYTVLQSKEYGIRHTDMELSRFIVRWAHPGDDASDCTLALTGWEHAHRAPLWACARLPPWLAPAPHPREVLTWESQRSVRAYVFQSVFRGPPAGWEWVVAHVFGATERWFEGVLGAHWAFRDTAEVLLLRLRAHWMCERPDVPFPLEVGGPHLSRVWARMAGAKAGGGKAIAPGDGGGGRDGVDAREMLFRTRNFVEEVRLAMNAFAPPLNVPDNGAWQSLHRGVLSADDVD